MRCLRLAVLLWIPTAAATVIGAGSAYMLVQQMTRSGANDPQLQVATDDAARLSAGATPADIAAGPRVDLATSLATATIVYSNSGAVLASTATLDATVPAPPLGALNAAAPGHLNTVTWQPRPGVRQAVVIAAYTAADGRVAGHVLVSRSLRLVEDRDNHSLQLAALAALSGVVITGVLSIAVSAWWLRRPTLPAGSE